MRRSGIDLSSECDPIEIETLRHAIKIATSNGCALELGTAAGGTLKELINFSKSAKKNYRFHVIDPMTYYPDQLGKVKDNLKSAKINPDEVDFFVGTSDGFIKSSQFYNLSFSFVFIDGDHRAYPLMKDLRILRNLQEGGIACFHDYKEKFPGVMWSLDHFLKKNSNYRYVSKQKSLVTIQKIQETNTTEVSSLDLIGAKIFQYQHKYKRSIQKRLNK